MSEATIAITWSLPENGISLLACGEYISTIVTDCAVFLQLLLCSHLLFVLWFSCITTVGVAYIWSSATLFIFSPKLSSHGSFKWTFKVKAVKAAAGWVRRNTYNICDNEFCFLYTKGGAHCKSRKLKLYSNVKNHISFAEVMEKQTRKWMECQFDLNRPSCISMWNRINGAYLSERGSWPWW